MVLRPGLSTSSFSVIPIFVVNYRCITGLHTAGRSFNVIFTGDGKGLGYVAQHSWNRRGCFHYVHAFETN